MVRERVPLYIYIRSCLLMFYYLVIFFNHTFVFYCYTALQKINDKIRQYIDINNSSNNTSINYLWFLKKALERISDEIHKYIFTATAIDRYVCVLNCMKRLTQQPQEQIFFFPKNISQFFPGFSILGAIFHKQAINKITRPCTAFY